MYKVNGRTGKAVLTGLFMILSGCSSLSYTADRAGVSAEPNMPPTPQELSSPTQVVVLGTGTPLPDIYRAGPSIAVIVKGEAYVFDLGAGALRRAHEAREQYNIPSLYPTSICCVFFTHLHSDHTADYPDIANTLWWRRTEPLKAFGPVGLRRMTDGMLDMMMVDIELRLASNQPFEDPDLYKVDVTEIEPGIVFSNEDIKITAFPVPHGDIKPSYGYRIDTADKSIVISGDTSFSEELVAQAEGVDLLFHEVISEAGLAGLPEVWQNYHGSSHTPTSDVARTASLTKPGKLVLYHGLYYGVPESSIVDEVKAGYSGEVILASDLDIFD